MRYTVFDVETPNHINHRMSAIGITLLEDSRIVNSFYSLVQPETDFDPFNIELTGITPQMVEHAPTFAQLWPVIRPLMEQGTLAAHNAPFDMAVLAKCLQAYDIFWQPTTQYVCTCQMAKRTLPTLLNHRLDTLCRYFGIELQHHQADSDAEACAQLLIRVSAQADPADFLRTYDLQRIRTLTGNRCGNKGGPYGQRNR